MLRATAWTVGLFGAGTAISRMFTSGWSQPLVLLALGMAFLFVSRKSSASARRSAPDLRPQAAVVGGIHPSGLRTPTHPEPSLQLRPPGAPVPVPVEQSA